MRKRLWAIHSLLGLICGLALLVIGLTGSVLVFHNEIASVIHPEIRLNEGYADSGERQRLPLGELMERTEERFPEFWIRGWLPRYGSELRDQAYLKRRDSNDAWHILYVDPYSGEMADRPIETRETLYGWFVELHYTFFADHLGMGITAFFAVGLCFLSISGLYLYRNFFKSLFRLRWGTSARIFFSDVHKTVGIAAIPFNLLLGFTGAYWNIDHIVHEMVEHGDEAEETAADYERPYDGAIEAFAWLEDKAQQHWPGFALNYVYFPTDTDRQFHLYGQTPGSHALRSPYGSMLSVDVASREVTYAKDLREAGLWAQVVDAFEPLHFGDFGGWTTKILWCLAGLAPGVLAVSGSAIWLTRKRRGRRENGRKQAGVGQHERELAGRVG